MTMPQDTPSRRSMFISYAHEDKEFAQKLARDLRRQGVDLWIDESEMRGGDMFSRKIAKEIKARDEFLVIVSPAVGDSGWVEAELHRAFNLRKGIISVLHKHCDDPPLLLDPVHFIDFTSSSYDDAFDKLLSSRGQIPPKRNLIRRLAYNNVARIIAALIILIALGGYLAYRFSPSHTFADVVAGKDSTTIVLQLQNRGGRPSTVIGGYRLNFRDLPIADRVLDLAAAPPGEVPGHEILQVALTTSGFKPELRGGVYPTAHQIAKLLSNHDIILEVDIKETGDRAPGRAFHTLPVRFPATRIESFIVQHLPTVVEGVTYAH